MIRFYTLASGSSGNCALLSQDGMHILIDAGISYRRICRALAELELQPDDLSGILITHDHTDHVAALAMFMKYAPVPVYTSVPTGRRLQGTVSGIRPQLRLFEAGEGFALGDLYVQSFSTPHDAPGSVGYTIEQGGVRRLGFATDLGHVTQGVLEGLQGSELVVLEANHDPEMLQNGPYPGYLKRRIGGDYGHLANGHCGMAAAELVARGTSQLILAHLSRENNTPETALDSVSACLRDSGVRVDADIRLSVAPAEESGRCWQL